MTKIQMALDATKLEDLVPLVREVHDLVDIVEIGTPFLLRSGLEPIRRLKAEFPGLAILADGKIMDGAKLISQEQLAAGADYLTVMAMADNSTIKEVVGLAGPAGSKVVADLLQVKDIGARSEELIQMGVDLVAVHTGLDLQARGRTPLNDLKSLATRINPARIAVAGGINLKSLPDYFEERPAIIIIGSALTKSAHMRQDLQAMRQIIER